MGVYIYMHIPIISVLNYQRNNPCLNEKKTPRVPINQYRTSPILGADGSRGGMRESRYKG